MCFFGGFDSADVTLVISFFSQPVQIQNLIIIISFLFFSKTMTKTTICSKLHSNEYGWLIIDCSLDILLKINESIGYFIVSTKRNVNHTSDEFVWDRVGEQSALVNVFMWHHVFIRRGKSFISVSVSSGKRYCSSGNRRQIMVLAVQRDKHGPNITRRVSGWNICTDQTDCQVRQGTKTYWRHEIHEKTWIIVAKSVKNLQLCFDIYILIY